MLCDESVLLCLEGGGGCVVRGCINCPRSKETDKQGVNEIST